MRPVWAGMGGATQDVPAVSGVPMEIQNKVAIITGTRRIGSAVAQRLAESEQRFNEANSRLREHEDARNQIKLRIESILARFDGLDLG